jgi:hypothetical protein
MLHGTDLLPNLIPAATPLKPIQIGAGESWFAASDRIINLSTSPTIA